jgi:uncharacterized protein (TIGR03083 family)
MAATAWDARAYAAALRRDGAALAAAAETDLRAAVPACPGWDVAELVWHMGGVHHFWGAIARDALSSPDAVRAPDRPQLTELVDWYRAGVERLAATLESADPSTPVWTWAPRKDVGFIQRRMAHETAVHRWDAESAVGVPGPIDAALAVDGIDEFLDVFLPFEGDLGASGESVHLHCTDAPGEWLVEIADGKLDVSRTHGKGDVAARGGASDLLLLLWRRVPMSRVDVHGDRAALERFLARTDLE